MPSRKTSKQSNHIRQSQTGYWTFRRRVPAQLQEYLGRKEWKVALRTKSHAEAALMAERHLRASEQAFMEARMALGLITDPIQITQFEAWKSAKQKLAGWDFHSDDVQDGYAMELIDMAEQGKLSPIGKQELRIINSRGNYRVNPTVKDACDLYRQDQEKKGRTEYSQRRMMQAIDRAVRAFEGTLGSLNVDIMTVGRAEARSYREELRNAGCAVGTANRYISVISAIFTMADREFELGKANPFTGLKEAEAGKDAKMPMTPEQTKRFIAGTPEGELRWIVRMLAGTGCRLSEIVGLRVEDVDVTGNIPHLIIRPNKVRSLKTKNSERKVPLIADSLESARECQSALNRDPLSAPKIDPPGAELARRCVVSM